MRSPSSREVEQADATRMWYLLADQVTSYPPSEWSNSLLAIVTSALSMEIRAGSLDSPVAPVLELVKR